MLKKQYKKTELEQHNGINRIFALVAHVRKRVLAISILHCNIKFSYI